jgi:hypothetical protein
MPCADALRADEAPSAPASRDRYCRELLGSAGSCDERRQKGYRGPACGVVCYGFPAAERGSGGALPTNSTPVVPFPNIDRRRAAEPTVVPSRCRNGHLICAMAAPPRCGSHRHVRHRAARSVHRRRWAEPIASCYLVAVLVHGTDFAAEFPCGKRCGVNVAIGRIRLQRVLDGIEITGRHILRGRSDHARGRERSRHRSSICRTRGSSRWSVIEIRAEEHHHAARHMHFAQMDVRLRNRRAQVREGERVGQRFGAPVQL